MATKCNRIFHRIRNWEFWPFSVFYLPVFFYFGWLALRCRSFFFFTASNPTIDFGGMLGESKSEIFELIPKEYLPKYSLIQSTEFKQAKIFATQIGYPIIAKPDIGERGNLVEVIHSESDLKKYHEACPVSYLIQDFVDLPIELGLFYIKMPGEAKGKITSIVEKQFLSVVGDGIHTVEELLESSPRAQVQLDFNHQRFSQLMPMIPKNGEKVKVEGIGNHCRGTIFLDAGNNITNKLEGAFDKVSSKIDSFYFGRFDLRCASYEALEELRDFKILELNGAGAEPGHIYHPGASLLAGYRSVFYHLSKLAEISRLNHRYGVPYWSFTKGISKIKAIKEYNRKFVRV
ncbi:MAG: hypothetical protein ACI83W_000195 [Marinoscillum sp.]|jgi:hypothetical protein